MNHAAGIEEEVAGLEHPIRLAFGLEHQRSFEHVTEFISGMGVEADGGAGRQLGGAQHDLLFRGLPIGRDVQESFVRARSYEHRRQP